MNSGNTLQHPSKRRKLAWIAFDPVTSIYIAIVPALLFPVYFERFVAGGEGLSLSWGLLASAAIVCSGLSGLAAAALTRRFPSMLLLSGFVGLLAASSVALSMTAVERVWAIAIEFLIAQSSYFAAMTIYESFLPAVAARGEIHRVSGLGWAIGFVGGIGGAILLLAHLGGAAEGPSIYRESFALVGLMTAVFAAPVLFAMHRAGLHTVAAVKLAPERARIFATVRDWRSHRALFLLLLSIMLIYSATAVVVNFTAPMIAATFGTTYRELLYLILVVQLMAMPSTYFISTITERWSRRVPVFLVVSGWVAVLLLLAYGREQWMVWLIVAVIGCCTGATNATMRSFLAEAVPAGHAEVFFGLMTFIGRMGSALGPLLFAIVAKTSGEVTALHVILGILLSGMAVLLAYLGRLPDRQALPEAAGPG